MLSEAFGDFTFDDDELVSERKDERERDELIGPTEYEAVKHFSKWFLDTKMASQHKDVRELASFKAALAYHEKDFDSALQCYKEMLKAGDHKNSYRYAVIDSIIRSALKSCSADMHAIVSLLHDEIFPLITTYGEQLQYWALSLEVYKKIGGFSWKYLQNAILLCASVDLAEHWMMLADTDFDDIQNGVKRFRLGCLCRALCLLEFRALNSRGIVRDISKKKTVDLRQQLHTEYGAEKVNAAKLKMCVRGVKTEMDVSPISFAAPHDCKMKGMLKEYQEQKNIISQFLNTFKWLFEECWHTVVVALIED
ncbi:unnamed protein product [Toxocara canis]|uniref:TPR_REGION domain-containing protein n=1 Tax=Toxocara canis TaxID=6265 RepID=A0A183V6H6_TOXCA|nr:unnamed protein product [Toxocara canis]